MIKWLPTAIAVVFYLHQNNYYGWHPLPASETELVVDGITCFLFSFAIAMFKRDITK